ncbi:MAG: response regulator [Nitrospirae bacterium]|nr:MAG: response regulator [Nitrospirota bacterium]
MPYKALIVDDERAIVELVRYHLEKEGMTCLEAADGETALSLARLHHPDVLILDLMLPGLDGLELCRILRRDPRTARIAIVMLTAKAEEVDKVVGLEMGADDYIVKPFSPRELVARVKAVLRRGQPTTVQQVQRVGTLEIDEATRRVRVGSQAVELTVKEFDLLCALLHAKGRVLNREQLLESVWGYTNAMEIESRTVDVHIRRLREKLGPESKRIITIKGVGYRFEVESDA